MPASLVHECYTESEKERFQTLLTLCNGINGDAGTLKDMHNRLYPPPSPEDVHGPDVAAQMRADEKRVEEDYYANIRAEIEAGNEADLMAQFGALAKRSPTFAERFYRTVDEVKKELIERSRNNV